MPDIIKICALGGLDENGRDCYVVEINNDIFVLDAGLSLPDKTIPGVDFLLANAEYLIANKTRIKAYILTHGHDENMGALPYFYDNAPAPVYCTEFTRFILEGETGFNKVKAKYNFVNIIPPSTMTIAGRKFIFFQTCHNAAYSIGVAIDTDKGYIVYTSDFIVDYSVSNKEYIFDMKTLSEISEKQTLVLMAESKTANKPGYCSPKHRVAPLIEKYFTKSNKRIFIDCFWQNFFRIHEIVNLCKANNKRLYFYNKYTAEVMRQWMSFNPNFIPKELILSKEDLLRVRNQDVVILILGIGEDLYEELTKIVEGKNEDRRIILGPDDIFINSAMPTPTLETLATKSVDALYRTGCDVVWIKKSAITSMHACQDDLKFFLSVLKPKYYFPIRGNYVNLIANAKLALSMGIGLTHMNVFILDNGMQLFIDENAKARIIPTEVNQIPVYPVMVDGRGISTVGHDAINDRRKLSVDGVVIVAASISKQEKRIIAGPDCQMRGFVYVKEAEPLLKSISNIFVDEVNLALANNIEDMEQVKNSIKERARRFIKRENGREPMILPIIIEL